MKNAKTINKLLAEIMDKTDMNPEIETIVGQLRDEFAARDTAMKQAFNPWDEESEEDFTPVLANDGGEDYKGKYEDLKRQYFDRFFNGNPSPDGNPAPNGNSDPGNSGSDIFEPDAKPISDLFE